MPFRSLHVCIGRASRQCGYASGFEDSMDEKMPCGMCGRYTARYFAGTESWWKVESSGDVASPDGTLAIT